MILDLEHVVVTFDQARQHSASGEIDFLSADGNLDVASRSNLRYALALNNDDLVGHEPVGLAVEQLPGVNHHYLLTFTCQTRAAESECKQRKPDCRLSLQRTPPQNEPL
jgi:hypothetical protein